VKPRHDLSRRRCTFDLLCPRPAQVNVDLLQLSQTQGAVATGTGLKALFDSLDLDEATTFSLFWFALTIIEKPGGGTYAQHEKITCTKRNVLRFAFGTSGGLEAVRKRGCGVEPELTPEQLNNFTIARYSRTDFDQAFTTMLCFGGFLGYYAEMYPLVKATPDFDPFADFRARFGTGFMASTTMDKEVFTCSSKLLKKVEHFDMNYERSKAVGANGRWLAVNSSRKFTHLAYPKVTCPDKATVDKLLFPQNDDQMVGAGFPGPGDPAEHAGSTQAERLGSPDLFTKRVLFK